MEECEKAFQEIKAYLGAILTLINHVPEESLILYLAVLENAMSKVLVKEEGRTQVPIYYVNKSLLNAETQYPEIEKLGLALITAARKLRPYFHAYTIRVSTSHPLRQIL
ncbi:hypothetical protein PanWU01x14_030710 [Parasponia andersonii]|uniref:Reverse transcriptase/retrotransposon-derived protein RNase H-like domain-containing protein n=1 Tax=Parasponia andersonii TaxID=3476 RepID=A0A2P5DUU3_PARAD|nr:hypothetical protein PanWU01x14_030710 [Parasponia andersonii]